MNNDNVVLLSMVGTGIIVTADDIKNNGGIQGRHILALGIVYLFLAGAADVAPKVAGPFAVLVLVGVALTKGPAIFNSLGKVGSSAINTGAANPTNNVNEFRPGVNLPPKKPLRSVH